MNVVNYIPQDSRMRSSPALRWLSRLFLFLGVLAIGYAAYFYVSAYAFQKLESHSFSDASPATGPASSPAVPTGEVMGRIEIGRLGVSAVFVQGDSEQILRRAVGHVPQTAVPGSSGNVVLTGHRDTFFRALRKIQEGDSISLETTGGEYQYAVESTAIVSPSATEVLQSSGRDELTLITCYPFYYIGAAPDRFVVHARRIGNPQEQF